MGLIYLSNSQKKLLFWVLYGLGIAGILLTILVAPCVTQVGWQKSVYNPEEQLLIVMMVVFPVLLSALAVSTAEHFRLFTKKEAIRQLEQQFNNGLIHIEKYKDMYEHLEQFDMEKKKTQIQTKTEQKLFQEKIKKMQTQIIENELSKVDENQEQKELI